MTLGMLKEELPPREVSGQVVWTHYWLWSSSLQSGLWLRTSGVDH